MSDDSQDQALPASLQTELRRNRVSRDAWDFFAEHRAIVTDQLARGGNTESDRTLCLLGAGNLNDVDLPRLNEVYRAIDLVDFDAEAMSLGLRRQGMHQQATIRAFGSVDLGGMAVALERWSLSPDGDGSMEHLIAAVDEAQVSLPRTDYDVVASLCLLSQLADAVAKTIGAEHPRLLDVVQTVRRRHLSLVLDHLRPGGLLLLVTDFVSTDTCPELLTVTPGEFPQAADGWIRARNFFTGLNPHVLHRALAVEPPLAERVAQVQLVRPWRWQFSERRAFAVCAVKAIVK